MTCQEVNEVASDEMLEQVTDVEFLRSMVRQLRKELAEAKFAAQLNHDTIKNRRSSDG